MKIVNNESGYGEDLYKGLVSRGRLKLTSSDFRLVRREVPKIGSSPGLVDPIHIFLLTSPLLLSLLCLL